VVIVAVTLKSIESPTPNDSETLGGMKVAADGVGGAVLPSAPPPLPPPQAERENRSNSMQARRAALLTMEHINYPPSDRTPSGQFFSGLIGLVLARWMPAYQKGPPGRNEVKSAGNLTVPFLPEENFYR
jgi:hypothetical protein